MLRYRKCQWFLTSPSKSVDGDSSISLLFNGQRQSKMGRVIIASLPVKSVIKYYNFEMVFFDSKLKYT